MKSLSSILLLLVLPFMVMVANAAITLPKDALVRQYYKKLNNCRDDVEYVIKQQMATFVKNDPTIPPKLVRLLYSDCLVTGCDASILLVGPNSERKASGNLRLGGFVVIDKIKKVLEARCPGVVSCADILNLATRDAIKLAGGPSAIIRTGRKDGFSSKASSVNLPSPSVSIDDALAFFESKNLDVQDYATLTGLHSMERAPCSDIKDRLYNYKGTGKPDPSMDKYELGDLRAQCPKTRKAGEHDELVFLNPESKYRLSNNFYQRILDHKAVLGVDQQLLYNNDTLQLTQEFAASMEDYKLALALSFARMGEVGVLTGSSGEIRRHCAYTNANNPVLK